MNKTILTILTLIVYFSVFAQKNVRQDNYYEFKFGIYQTKSIDKELIGFKPNIIEPQTEILNEENAAFLKVENKVIALFDRINDSGTTKPLGVLTKTSVIQVDTIFYKEIFKDTTKEWHLTFNVWYAITINGQQYYTDYKIHDFISFRQKLDKYNQEFLLISQSTGYDEFYDNGYPNYFFVAIFNDKQELIYSSDILDFDYGDEFWDAELMSSVSTEITEKGIEFTLFGIKGKFEGIWTGKELKK